MVPLSVLDLAPIVEGGDAGQAFRNALDLARHAESWGYERFWMAEHHSMPGIASAATAVALAYVGTGTSTIRIGAGGIMLPNHAPLVIAEQFGTLESLYPGRVELGIGRAPGTDQAAAAALRRNLAADIDRFPEDVSELIDYFRPAEPGRSEERRVGKECRSRWEAYHSSRRRHTRFDCDWSSDVCSSDLRRAVRDARIALSGPGRARHRPGAGDRPGGRRCAAPQPGRGHRPLPGGRERADRLFPPRRAGQIGRASCRERV